MAMFDDIMGTLFNGGPSSTQSPQSPQGSVQGGPSTAQKLISGLTGAPMPTHSRFNQAAIPGAQLDRTPAASDGTAAVDSYAPLTFFGQQAQPQGPSQLSTIIQLLGLGGM